MVQTNSECWKGFATARDSGGNIANVMKKVQKLKKANTTTMDSEIMVDSKESIS